MTIQSSQNSTPAKTMADLLKANKSAFVTLHKGDTIAGKISKISSSEILLDIDTKTEAVVLEKDRRIMKQLLSLLHIGDLVNATVLNPESDLGYPVVSLRRFAEEKLWGKLNKIVESKRKLDVVVKEATKGGFIVEAEEGISGFLPNSHVSFNKNQQELVGQKISVGIVELNREIKKIIFSQKAVFSDLDFKNAREKLKVGQKVTATVTNITSFGIFVSVGVEKNEETAYLDGLIHISEISWEKLEEISGYKVGDSVEAIIIGFDEEVKRIDLSVKRLAEDPFEKSIKHFAVDQKIVGVITKMRESGVLLDITTPDNQKIEAMIRKEKIPPTVTYDVGQKVTAIISQIDVKKRKVVLVPVLLEKPIGYR